MQIGVLSDTHDNMNNIEKAVSIFNERAVEKVLHAGDFTSPFTFRKLNELKAEFIGIFGNNDGDIFALNNMSKGRIFQQPHEITIKDRKILMIHEHFLVNSLADSGHYNVIIYGHTHQAVTEKRGNTLVLNPGETGSWLYGKGTIAILDIENLEAEIVNL